VLPEQRKTVPQRLDGSGNLAWQWECILFFRGKSHLQQWVIGLAYSSRLAGELSTEKWRVTNSYFTDDCQVPLLGIIVFYHGLILREIIKGNMG